MPDHHDDLDEGLLAKQSGSLLRADVIGDLVGVIDLRNGSAVHAVAGRRAEYRPVDFLNVAGDPNLLARHYWSLGLRRLYVADLNGIECGEIQMTLLECLLADAGRWDEILLDLGSGGSMEASLDRVVEWLGSAEVDYKIILATEAVESSERFRRLVEAISSDRVLLGLDYRGGVFVSSCGDEWSWLGAARGLGVSGAVVLDIASVGTSNSAATVARCQRIRFLDPSIRLYSGGGIRSADDIRALRRSGCDRFLVATALHQIRL